MGQIVKEVYKIKMTVLLWHRRAMSQLRPGVFHGRRSS